MNAANAITQLKEAVEDLEAGLEAGIRTKRDAVSLLESLQALLMEAKKLGRQIVKEGAPEHADRAESHLWTPLNELADESPNYNLRELIGDIEIEIPDGE